jgi:hypothetical protein
LNSGLNLNGIGFEPNAFSFLKLHGSVGMWIGDFAGDPMYFQDEPDNKNPAAIKDSLFFVDRPNNHNENELKRGPAPIFSESAPAYFVAGNGVSISQIRAGCLESSDRNYFKCDRNSRNRLFL